jgi:hypothetical protein
VAKQVPRSQQPLTRQVRADHFHIEENQMPNSYVRNGPHLGVCPQPAQTRPAPIAEKLIQQFLCTYQLSCQAYFVHGPLKSRQPLPLSILTTISVHSLPFRRTIARLFVMGGTTAQSPFGLTTLSGHRPSRAPSRFLLSAFHFLLSPTH